MHISSIKVQLTCMVIARYCVIKWLDPFVSCSSHYFNGLELIFLVSLRYEYDCGWKCAKQPEFLSESGRKASASHAKMIILHLKTFPQRSSFFQNVTRPDVAERRQGAKRPLLQANEKQMLGGRDFLLACVCVLQHIPFHLLHVSALLWLLLCRVSLQLELECSDLARGDGNMWKPFAEFDWPWIF